MKTEYMTTKKELQIDGFCARPVILDYTADRTTLPVLFPHTLKGLAVPPKLSEQKDTFSNSPGSTRLSSRAHGEGKDWQMSS